MSLLPDSFVLRITIMCGCLCPPGCNPIIIPDRMYPMRRIALLILVLAVLGVPAPAVQAAVVRPAARQQPAPATDAYSLIAAVNALRASNGLAAYSINPILMSVSQAHAEYMAATGTVTHYDASGLRPYQRGVAAGYPLSGDLSLGGFYSENIMAGNNLSVDGAVQAWQGDQPHLTTMLSPGLTEIGAGVSIVGTYVYYDIDCARPTGSGQQQAYTPAQGMASDTPVNGTAQYVAPPLASTIVPNTPLPDGKLYHIVGPGETLWLIAVSYGVKLADIRKLNNMTDVEILYPGRKLLIRDAGTLTPRPPTATRTTEPTWTSAPSDTPLPSPTRTAIPVAPVSSNSSLTVLGVIVLAALILAGIFVQAGRHAH